MPPASESKIDGEWLEGAIERLAGYSENPPPAVTRILFSAADQAAKNWVETEARQLGLQVRKDPIGNLFARWVGANPYLPAVATGSHIDAIPNAGKYDGVVGVLGPLALFRNWRKTGFQPIRSIELIVFAAEEPTRFGIGCLGSRLMAGALSNPDELKDSTGKSLADWMLEIHGAAADLAGCRVPSGQYAGFVELHIEQGPILERTGVEIGIVERIAAPAALRIQVQGAGGHAGTVLMPDRRDALTAAAEIVLAVERSARSRPSTVGTTGVLRLQPGAINSIPFATELEIDVRGTELKDLDALVQEIITAAATICERRNVSSKSEIMSQDLPGAADAQLVDLAELVSNTLGLTNQRMISWAYHDALFMSQICPTLMLFVPCRGGISHSPDEYTSTCSVCSGTAVLGALLARLAMDG